MATFSSLTKERLFGLLLIAAAIVANEWILTKVISPDGAIEALSLKASIWAFNLSCAVGGSFLFLYGRAASDIVHRQARWILLGLSAALLGLWLVALVQVYAGWGLFRFLGSDFGIYLAQANVLRSGDPRGIYSIEALQPRYQQLYDSYSSVVPDAANATQVPYPPLFAWLFTVFTGVEPHIGFALWTVLNVVAAVFLVWSAARFFPTPERGFVALLLFASYPVLCSLITGQPTLLLACAMGGFYLALRAGKDFQAGLYLSLLLFKPQYGVLLGPLLIWKRRWEATAGVGLGAIIIIGGSLLVAGLPTLLAYPGAFTEMAKFRGDVPTLMINWRSLILWLSPQISDQSGMLLELLLSGLTLMIAAFAWRGPWEPREQRFSLLMTLTIAATLLANHHSLPYGAVLLAVPLASALAEADMSRFTRLVSIAACLLPALSFTLLFALDLQAASRLLMVLLAMTFASLLFDLNSGRFLRAPD
jgi:Glycosyltransferase family 87